MVFSTFDHAFFLNCEHRADRRKFFETQAQIINIDVERFSAIQPQNSGRFAAVGVRGCHESHVRVWELGREREYDSFLVFEDDAAFTQEGLQALQTLRTAIISSPWDMLYFQVKKRRSRGCENLMAGLHRIHASILTHAYAVRRHALDYLIDMGGKNDRLPLDIYLFEHVHPNISVFGIGPTVAFQARSRSDVCPYSRPSFPVESFTPVYKAVLDD